MLKKRKKRVIKIDKDSFANKTFQGNHQDVNQSVNQTLPYENKTMRISKDYIKRKERLSMNPDLVTKSNLYQEILDLKAENFSLKKNLKEQKEQKLERDKKFVERETFVEINEEIPEVVVVNNESKYLNKLLLQEKQKN